MTLIDPRPLDILDGSFYVDDPWSRYAWLRENSPCHWDAINNLWVITRYDDIIAIEKDKATFINSGQGQGGYRPNIPADPSIIGTDDPLHSARRNLISRRFTPRAVMKWEEHVAQTVASLVDPAIEKGEADVVADLAAPLPAMMITLLLGFPDEMWPKLQRWSETTIALGGGPRYFDDAGTIAAMDFAQACADLYVEKTACPADDVMSVWIEAEKNHNGEVGGEPFGLDQIISDCLLVLDGGAETTRTVIARTILGLADHPDQWALLKSGADMDVAVEEFVRWVTPVHNFTRTATRDVELHGQAIREGQQVILMYAGANRDPSHFEDPNAFDVTRSPNNHLSFGFGTHFCLGASLARLEIKTFFERLVAGADSIERIAEKPHVEMPNAFVYGLRESHVRLTPSR